MIIFFDLYNQLIRKKIIKALIFHGIGLFLAVIGNVVHYSNVYPLTAEINLVYWFILCVMPPFIIMTEAEKYTRDTLPENTSFRWRPRCKLRDFRLITTFKSWYRDSSVIQQTAIFFSVFFVISPLFIGFMKLYPHIPFLWFMGIFCVGMICHYVQILYKLQRATMVITQSALVLPIFAFRKDDFLFIRWEDVTHLEILASEENLYVDEVIPFDSLKDNIAFIRGVIIHYKSTNKYLWKIERKQQKMCVITDELLDTRNLWKLYNYSNNYVGQQDLKLRLAYGQSAVRVRWSNETYGSAIVLAKIRLDAAFSSVNKKVTKNNRPVRSKVLMTKPAAFTK